MVITVAVLLLRPAPPPRPPAPAPVPLPTPRTGTMARTSVTDVKISKTGITLHENPADPVWVSSYRDVHNDAATYVRDPARGDFSFFGSFEEPIVSPGGRFVASLRYTRLTSTDFESIRLRDRATGQDREVRTVDKPRTLMDPSWSGDGRRVLATVLHVGREQRAVGFAVVDPVTGSVKITESASAGDARYHWGSDHDSVLQQAADGSVRVLDLDGKVLRSFTGVGRLTVGGATGTPFGVVFATVCPGQPRRICFWDERTGARKGEARLAAGATFNGWLDGRHFLSTVRAGKRTDVFLADAGGERVRTLITGPADELDKVTFWYSAK
uniref:hypothetical protein n=1 Tax=Nonomuraea gerenzanensis TaxID=93944 RepID=UPI00287FC745|nr:hypothetical protein [Nonomuraea gerenzanensis]